MAFTFLRIVLPRTQLFVRLFLYLTLKILWSLLQAAYQGKTYKLRIPFPRRAEDRK